MNLIQHYKTTIIAFCANQMLLLVSTLILWYLQSSILGDKLVLFLAMYSIDKMVAYLHEALKQSIRSAIIVSESICPFKSKAQRQIDSLTGLLNKEGIEEKIDEIVEEFAFLIIKMDNLLKVNQVLGHTSGDLLLTSIAKRLQESTHNCLIARFYDAEFAVLIAGQTKAESADTASRILSHLCLPFYLADIAFYSTPKIGLFFGKTSSKDAIHKAKLALAKIKNEKQPSYSYYCPALHDDFARNIYLGVELRKAISAKQFDVQYQPIFDISLGRVDSLEALVRWNHPEKGCIPPSDFIGFAEECGLIGEIGWYVMRRACQQMHEWKSKYPVMFKEISLNINLSGEQFMHHEFASITRSIVDESGLNANSVKLEITETMLLNPKKIVGGMSELCFEGFRFCLDDFGTGYSSLGYLQSLPIGILKIDRSFVSSLDTDSKNALIVQTISRLANSLKMEMVAEGVQRSSQIEMLRSMNCSKLQGFYFSRPVWAKQVPDLVKTLNSACS